MTRNRPIAFLASAAVIPLAALAIAGCGGGSGATAAVSPYQEPAPTATAKLSRTATVRVASSRLGRVLVNFRGRTLYLFKADSRSKSRCSGSCASAWPPLLATGRPIAGTGLTASKLGTITRSDGKRQVTYNGHPLYTFVKDQKSSQTTGQGVTAFGAAWFAVSAAGTQIASHATTHGSSSSSSQPAAPAAPVPSTPPPAPTSTAQPAPPVATTAPPANSGIPQNNGGDGDGDNNGGPSDGDGNL